MPDTDSLNWEPRNKRAEEPPPTPKEWDPTTFHAPHTRSGPEKNEPAPPPVPGGTGQGRRTSVDTPSMELFADNMDRLAEPVKQAYQKLIQLQRVNPGAFYDGYALRQAASGTNGDSGLQSRYLKVLHDLGQGLADISSGMRQLSQKYKTVEEESKMTAEDLNNAMQSAQSDFSKIGSGA
ncbi:hypothetical protein [Streptomyces chartreusis]|uniref:Uncharacterized protein n=1 Tax=Streptomyces chartreusis TaxID=1969 RepID=A0A7I0Y8Y3_STRCX|nr:hypothetical protein [Streptomyces chartreusis]QKZ15964.1 hypothetical protein HUT05_00195 [Streptomyces chartreusis]